MFTHFDLVSLNRIRQIRKGRKHALQEMSVNFAYVLIKCNNCNYGCYFRKVTVLSDFPTIYVKKKKKESSYNSQNSDAVGLWKTRHGLRRAIS